jgi:hypothetical protein
MNIMNKLFYMFSVDFSYPEKFLQNDDLDIINNKMDFQLPKLR